MFVRVASESGAQEFSGVGRSHVSHWVGGSKPSGRAPLILREALSRLLHQTITLEVIGLTGPPDAARMVLDWQADTLVALTDLGTTDVDVVRRRLLGAAAYSVAALTLPTAPWWSQMVGRSGARSTAGARRVGRGDLDAVRDMVAMFSRADQRRGGGHARMAVVQYLTLDVVGYLRGNYSDPRVRQKMFSAASELAYLCGWMAFDDSEQAIAQHYFSVAVKLAAEGDDPPMAGHVLRAMAHQAVDLGHSREALGLAGASMDGSRYTLASPRERALLGVVKARSLAATGEKRAAVSTLICAENDLRNATPGDDEPGRVFFFGEASLAHETACALRDMGDLAGALTQFRRSVRTREITTFTRTHAVTLGYLGAVQAKRGEIEEACTTWSDALDAMDGIRSGRTRHAAMEMRSLLAQFRSRNIRGTAEIESRAAKYLSGVA